MKSQSPGPKEIRFGNPRLNDVGIEWLDLAGLKSKVGSRHLSTPERAEFFMLLLVTQGVLRHTVDFTDLRLGAGGLVFVRPGQVQQWHLDAPVQGSMVMIDPPALLPVIDTRGQRDTLLAALEDWPAGVRLDETFAAELQVEFGRLAKDLDEHDRSENDVMLIRQTVLGVMLRVARWHRKRWQQVPPSQIGSQEVYRLFRRELEQRFRGHWKVAEFARRLGFSESTLNRACRSAAGQSAKVLLDRRVALEAARMLVHGRASVADVGHALGFSEPTNFVRFFVRMIGSTPAGFRRLQGPSTASVAGT
jgi:AraC-like DNA-binding protein